MRKKVAECEGMVCGGTMRVLLEDVTVSEFSDVNKTGIATGQHHKEDKCMKQENKSGISFFQRYLTIWVILCMILGIIIGKYLPGIPSFLNRFEYVQVSIPMAI